jgi:flagellar hook protein FlgE
MASEISTIQSLKAVDAWIDVINANINGGVRTAFKTSRLKFAGSNTSVDRAGTSTSLPLQFPEPSLVTQNTAIDFSQGAITVSTENSHLAIQGPGFFLVADPGSIRANGTCNAATTSTRLYLTRDGEFHTNQNGLLVNSAGFVLVTASILTNTHNLNWDTGAATSDIRAVYNNLDNSAPATVATGAYRLSDFVAGIAGGVTYTLAGGGTYTTTAAANLTSSILKVTMGQQNLKYTTQGATVFDFGFIPLPGASIPINDDPSVVLDCATTADATVLNKSLEASNASMTQSVPELSLAQKLFSALTKVLQTKQTNVDGVLNLVR